MEKLFGTDGMRGEAGIFPLDAATIEIVGASLAKRLKQKLGHSPVILIGRDTRESGEWLERALISGASKAGAESKSAGVITTPGVAFLTRTLPADAGVVISASHNAYSDNGVKIFAPSGRKLDEETERLIESDVFSASDASRASARNTANDLVCVPKRVSADDATGDLQAQYLDFLANEIGKGISLKGVKLVLDCANGAASGLAPQLFERLGTSVTSINESPNGRNINLDCGSLHTESLQREVVKQNADIGVAFDGDADRALFVDSQGRVVNGDGSLWVLAKYLHARQLLNQDLVVSTVMSNIGLEHALRSQGLQLVRTDVGDKYVLDELLRLGTSLGGEQSGHLIFPRLSFAGDGLITTICLLRAITEQAKSLEELTAGLQIFPQVLVNVMVKRKRPFDEVESIRKVTRAVEDGLGSRGRLLLRYSGTESVARVMIEGESQNEIEKQAREIASVIEKALGGDD